MFDNFKSSKLNNYFILVSKYKRKQDSHKKDQQNIKKQKQMNKKFKRQNNTSFASTTIHNRSHRQNIIQQQINELANNTIIPLVTSKFMIVPRYHMNRTESKFQLDQSAIVNFTNINKNPYKLGLMVICRKIQKSLTVRYGRCLINKMKQKVFKQKLSKFIDLNAKELMKEGFLKLKKIRTRKDIYQKLYTVNYINKKLTNNNLSYAFRKIILNSMGSSSHQNNIQKNFISENQSIFDISLIQSQSTRYNAQFNQSSKICKEVQNQINMNFRTQNMKKKNLSKNDNRNNNLDVQKNQHIYYSPNSQTQSYNLSSQSSIISKSSYRLKPDSIKKPQKDTTFWKINVSYSDGNQNRQVESDL